MNLNLVCLNLIIAAIVVEVKGDCWWTGCQPTSWAQRGCSVYNMDETKVEDCDDGNKYYCCDKKATPQSSSGKRDCWWTGCQPTSWAERGCSVYKMDEVDRELCDGGDKYRCCKKDGSSSTSNTNKRAIASSAPRSSSTSSSSNKPKAKRECWWTGCQPTSWAQRGCSVYDMDEVSAEECEDGNKYECCSKEAGSSSSSSSSKPKSSSSAKHDSEEIKRDDATAGCWWTGCQPSVWRKRGCSVYEMDEIDSGDCDDGKKFHCCPRKEKKKTNSRPPISASVVEENSKCWWTGCQPSFLKTRGCEVFGLKELDRLVCNGGNQFYCCEEANSGVVTRRSGQSSKKESVDHSDAEPDKKTPEKGKCWWTGCQPDSWAQRGCGVYDMDEVETSECDNGLKYNCCDKGTQKAVVKNRSDSNKLRRKLESSDEDRKCSWTGCQPRAWSDRGCLVEGQVEVETKWCEGGQKYYCCEGGNTEKSERRSTTGNSNRLGRTDYSRRLSTSGNSQRITSKAKKEGECWWTGCQPYDWAERGCVHYRMNQIKVQACPHGERFYCCSKAVSPDVLH